MRARTKQINPPWSQQTTHSASDGVTVHFTQAQTNVGSAKDKIKSYDWKRTTLKTSRDNLFKAH